MAGRVIESTEGVSLVEETLSDGSKVYEVHCRSTEAATIFDMADEQEAISLFTILTSSSRVTQIHTYSV